MPRMTSEYIQASSRVGRRYPGLAINVFSSQRLREVSIFENYSSYHDAYYKYVEPLSITPVTYKTIGAEILVNIFKIYRNIDPRISVDTIVNDMAARFNLDDSLKKDLQDRMTDIANTQAPNVATSLREVDKNAFISIND